MTSKGNEMSGGINSTNRVPVCWMNGLFMNQVKNTSSSGQCETDQPGISCRRVEMIHEGGVAGLGSPWEASRRDWVSVMGVGAV